MNSEFCNPYSKIQAGYRIIILNQKMIHGHEPHQAIEHPASLSGVSVTGFPAIACAKAFAK
jgi:phage head maturation protease